MTRVLLLLAVAASMLTGCGSKDQQQAATQPPAKLPPNMKLGYQPPTTKQ